MLTFRLILGLAIGTALVSPGLAGIKPCEETSTEIRFCGVEQKSASIESAIPDALEAILDVAVPLAIPKADTAAQRRALDLCLRAAKEDRYRFVNYTTTDGPRKRPGAAGYVVLNATVSKAEIRQLFDANLTTETSKPEYTIMILVEEEINSRNAARPILSRQHITRASISDALRTAGYTIINPRQFENIQDRQFDFEKMAGEDAALLQRIAADQGADILVFGLVQAEGPRLNPRVTQMTGRQHYFWEVDGTAHAVWTDSGQELFSIPFPNGPADGASAASPEAGAKKSLQVCGQTFAEEFLEKLTKHLKAPRFITLEVRNCSFVQMAKIKRWLGKVDQFSELQTAGFNANIGRYKFKSDHGQVMDGLLELLDLAEQDNADFLLDVVEQKHNTIITKVVPN